jgi:serine/threonine-protein kinase
MLEQLRNALAGRYDVEREIGKGGMATVYLARDLRHDRRVALKLLNPDLGALLGVERFLSEIKVTAQLQHPNLLPLFDSGEADGHLFYVMPYVEGETLRARLEREKQLPIDEAIRMSVAIANALDYAHSHDVIHRDLKPENVLLQAGQPVIADFGIALAVSQAGGNRITQTGLSLGTPQYMSPEQATGDRVIDKRSDIYSLAAMTYEMLTGEAPHTGNTSQAIIARLLTEKPRPIRSSRPAVPEHVEAAIEHALEKLPADRFSSAHEFAESLLGHSMMTGAATASRTRVVPPRSRWRDPVVIGLAAVALIAIAVAAFGRRTAPPAAQTVRFTYSGSDSTAPTANYPWPGAISPDGSMIVYSVIVGGSTALYALRTDQLDARRIPGTEEAYQAIFSPDGQWLAFQQRGATKKMRLDGMSPITVAPAAGANGMAWSARDELFFGAEGRNHGLSKAMASGGELSVVTHPDTTKAGAEHVWPVVSPKGDRVYFIIWEGAQPSARIASVSSDGGDVTELGIKGLRTLAVIDGSLIYVDASGVIMAIALSRNGKSAAGSPVPVHDRIGVAPMLNGNSEVYVSQGGALLTSLGTVTTRLTLQSANGQARPMAPAPQQYSTLAVSPDESRVALTISDASNQSDIWIYERGTGTFSRLTSGMRASGPQWMPNGKDLVYLAPSDSSRFAIYTQPANGSAPAQLITRIPNLVGAAWITPDGKTLLYSAYVNTSWGTYSIALQPGAKAVTFLDRPAQEFVSGFSPDGQWMLYTSNESGSLEVYATSYPDLSARVQISQGGGSEGKWSHDGSRIYYRQGNSMMVARIATTPALRVIGRDTVIARTSALANTLGSAYDLMKDGTILSLVPDHVDYRLVVVPNWMPELRERMRVK